MSTTMNDSVVEPPTTTDGFTLTLTSIAATKVQAILQERNVPDYGLRVFVAGVGCSGIQYGLGLESQAHEKDTVLESNGLRLYVDPASAEYLHGATIDYVEHPSVGGFRIENPNIAITPSCGQQSGCDGCH